MNVQNRILGGLWGSLVGDALGVPVEFKDRATLRADPVNDMRGFGSHHQPPGTWSDDGALTLCTVDSLLYAEFDTQDMGRRFVRWMKEEYWTATGVVFDVGGATADALMRIAKGVPAEQAGGRDEYANGNGSLMRVLPVALRFAAGPMDQLADRLERASAITHGHVRSRLSCAFYGFVIRELLQGQKPEAALHAARTALVSWDESAVDSIHFRHVLKDNLIALPEGEVVSTGYVLHTLHASLWCLLTTSSFEECVLRAVNLGGDTDTTGCVAGGLAGVYYGVDAVPDRWKNALPRREDLTQLFQHFSTVAHKPK